MFVFYAALISLTLVKREGLVYYLGAWRAETFLEKSITAGEAGDWDASSRLVLAAWQLHPGNLPVLRQLFTTSRQQGSIDALMIGRTLFKHPEATTEDRVEAMQVFFRVGDHVTVENLLSRLSADERKSPVVMTLSTRFLISRQRPLEALRVIDQLRRTRDEKSDLLLAADALSLIDSEGNRARDEAQRIIDELFRADGDPEVALKAFSLLSRIPAGERELVRFSNAGERLDALAKSAPVPASLWLLADEIEIALSPGRREAILFAAIRRWLDEAPIDLGEWLLNLKEPTLLLSYFPRELAAQNLDRLALHVQAYAMKKEWANALMVLERAPQSVDPAIVFGLRGMIGEKVGKVAVSNQDWQRALRYAGLVSGRDSLLRLSHLADLADNPEIRSDAVTEALKRPSALPLAASDVSFLFAELADKDRDADLLQISIGLLATQPENPQLLNNVVWLELLKGEVNEERIEKLAEFVARFPNITGLSTTLALARLSTGKETEALSILEPMITRLENTENEVPAADLAVAAFALSSNGEIDRARDFAGEVEWQSMMQVEREFFEDALK